MTAVFVFPILIQVDQHIDPTIQMGSRMFIKIGVDFQHTAGFDLMEAASFIIGIGE